MKSYFRLQAADFFADEAAVNEVGGEMGSRLFQPVARSTTNRQQHTREGSTTSSDFERQSEEHEHGSDEGSKCGDMLDRDEVCSFDMENC